MAIPLSLSALSFENDSADYIGKPKRLMPCCGELRLDHGENTETGRHGLTKGDVKKLLTEYPQLENSEATKRRKAADLPLRISTYPFLW